MPLARGMAWNMGNAAYLSLSTTQITAEVARLQPSWVKSISLLTQLWIYGEFVVLLFNKKRRGQQDFMAGTVVAKANFVAAKGAALGYPPP